MSNLNPDNLIPHLQKQIDEIKADIKSLWAEINAPSKTINIIPPSQKKKSKG